MSFHPEACPHVQALCNNGSLLNCNSAFTLFTLLQLGHVCVGACVGVAEDFESCCVGV